MASFNKTDYSSSDDDMNREWTPSSDDSEPETAHDSPNRGNSRDQSGSSADATDEETSSEVLPPMTGRLVLVTGGAGFIGSHVSEFLLRRGDEVVVVDEVNDYYDTRIKRGNVKLLSKLGGKKRFHFHEGNLCDVDFITGVWEQHKPRLVVHLAARAGVRPSIQDPFIYIQSNIEATTRLLELARTHGSDSFVFASSSSVYGGSMESVFKETDVVDFPVSPYAASKKACELMAHTYHHLYGLNIAGLRFFTVYGPRGRPDMAPFKFVDRISRGVPIQQFGDGSSSRDYTYIDDIVDGVVRSLDTPLGFQVYNLGGGDPVDLRDFIKLVEKATGKEALIEMLPDQPGDVARTAADVSKARKLLGYEPKVPFADGIKRTAEWYKNEYTRMDEAPEMAVEQPNKSNVSPSAIPKSTSMLSFALGSHNETGAF